MPSFDPKNLTPEQQEILDYGFGSGKKQSEADALSYKQGQEKKYNELLEKLTSTEKMTEGEREKYQKELNDLKNSTMTEKEKADKAITKAKEDAEKRVKEVEGTANQFKTLYESTLISNALTQAAVKADAFKTDQVVELLRGRVHLEEVKEGDKFKGYVPKFRNNKGDIVDLDTGVTEFMTENANLKKSSLQPGTTYTGAPIDRTQLRDPRYVNENIDKIVNDPSLRGEPVG